MADRIVGGIPVPQCWLDYQEALENGIDRVLVYGAPGIGKTYGGLTYGLSATGNAERLICTEDMSTLDVAGGWLPNATGGFVFSEGALLRAWQGDGIHGSRVVIDEIDKAGGDVFAQMLAFTDTVDSATFTRPDNKQIVRPLPGFSVVMTSNIESPNELPDALKDRFPIAIKIDAAHPGALLKLPESLRMLAAQYVAEVPGNRLSLRAFYAFNTLRKGLGVERAARMSFGHLAPSIVNSLSIGTLEPDTALTSF